jgi:hypothetical protein
MELEFLDLEKQNADKDEKQLNKYKNQLSSELKEILSPWHQITSDERALLHLPEVINYVDNKKYVKRVIQIIKKQDE